MTAVIIIIAVLVLIGIIPVGIDASYSDGIVSLGVRVSVLNIRLFPRQKAVSPKKKKKTTPAKEKGQKKKKKKPDFDTILNLLKLVLRAQKRFFKKLTFDLIRLHYTVGGQDPYSSALQYGYISAGLGALLPYADKALNIRERDIELQMDFGLDKPDIDARAVLTIQIWELLYVALAFGLELLSYQIKRRRKKHHVERMKVDGKQPDKRSDADCDVQDKGHGGRKHGGRSAYNNA